MAARWLHPPSSLGCAFLGGRLPGEMLRRSGSSGRAAAEDWDVGADVWSAPGWQRLRQDALDCEEWNRLHPTEDQRVPLVTQTFAEVEGPLINVTDWAQLVPDSISRWLPLPYTVLGTDGFGRSDTRPALRRHFKIDAENIAVAVLQELALAGDLDREKVAEAIMRYDLDPDAATRVP
jgi:pyruvate dehydrogenase E1 component